MPYSVPNVRGPPDPHTYSFFLPAEEPKVAALFNTATTSTAFLSSLCFHHCHNMAKIHTKTVKGIAIHHIVQNNGVIIMFHVLSWFSERNNCEPMI